MSFAEPDANDWQSALSYMSLVLGPKKAGKVLDELKSAGTVQFKADDILRAARRDPLPLDDPGVQMELKRPGGMHTVLLFVWKQGADIADGYHRVSALYASNPFALIDCKISYLK